MSGVRWALFAVQVCLFVAGVVIIIQAFRANSRDGNRDLPDWVLIGNVFLLASTLCYVASLAVKAVAS